MTTTACEVAVIGDIYLDHVFSGFTHWPSPGAEIFTDHYTPELGGGALATACALARLGRNVRLVGAVGHSDFDALERRLAHFGVDSGLIARSPDRTGTTVSISTLEDRTFFTYRGANRELQALLDPAGPLVAAAAAARHVHLALPLDLTCGLPVLEALRAQSATLSLDVGHQVEWLQSPAGVALLCAVDYFLPNQQEARILTGSPAADPARYFDFCRNLGVPQAVLKLGRDGAAMLAGNALHRVAAPHSSVVVDTTGAGDAFNAGLIDGLLDQLAPRPLLQRACACGTLSIRAAGAVGSLPTRAELITLSETYDGE